MKYYLGVDGGGSKTYTLIVDECGTVVGKGKSGNGNHQTGYEQARLHIAESVGQALSQSGLAKDDIAFAYFGLAGADREVDYGILRPMIAELGFPHYDVNGDVIIALRAGTARPYGVVLICGAGTNSAGLNPEGRFCQVGGFSYLLGDFGGGEALSAELFRTVVRAWDGREQPTDLTGKLLQMLGYASVQDMFDDYLDHQLTPPLDTVKLLFDSAAVGDSAARAILRRQGEELGKSAVAVVRKLGMENESFDVVLAGSILSRGQGDDVHEPIREALRTVAPRAALVRLSVEPVVGAVRLAMEASGNGHALSAEAAAGLDAISEFDSIQVRRPILPFGKEGIRWQNAD